MTDTYESLYTPGYGPLVGDDSWPVPPSGGGVFVYAMLPDGRDVWDMARWDDADWDAISLRNIQNLTDYVHGLSTERGRGDPLDHVRPGALRLTLDNSGGEWTPWTADGGFRAWRPGVPIRVADSDGPPLFTGFVTSIEEVDDPDLHHAVEVQAYTVDALMAMSNREEQSPQGAGELPGARLHRVCDWARLPLWVERDFDPGTYSLQATTLAREALTEAWLTADSDAGVFLVSREGILTYWDRDTLAGDTFTRPQFTFSDDPVDTMSGGAAPVSIKVTADAEPVLNWVQVACKDGSARVAEDLYSQAWYGVRSTQRNDLVYHPGTDLGAARAQTIAQLMLERSAADDLQISPIVGDPANHPEWREAVRLLDIGTCVRERRTRHGRTMSMRASVQTIRHDITPYTWQVTYNLAITRR